MHLNVNLVLTISVHYIKLSVVSLFYTFTHILSYPELPTENERVSVLGIINVVKTDDKGERDTKFHPNLSINVTPGELTNLKLSLPLLIVIVLLKSVCCFIVIKQTASYPSNEIGLIYMLM